MKRLITVLAVPLLASSCSTMYIPAVRSIPLFEKKGEFQMEAGASTNSVYANVSAAITNDIAVSINGNMSYRNFTDYYDIFTHKDEEYSTDSRYGLTLVPDLRGMFAHRYGEASVGKINILPNFPLRLEVFGGAGMGRATDLVTYSSSNCNYKTDYYSFFGQGNFGIRRRNFEAGLSMRLVCSIFNYRVNYKKSSGEDYLYQEKFGAVGLEPMGFARAGGKNLKAVFKIGLNLMLPINVNKENTSYYYYRGFTDYGSWDYTVLHFSIGLSYRIGGKKT